MDFHQIVTKLIGPIKAAGDESLDEARLENLKVTIELVDALIWDIQLAAKDTTRHEASMRTIGKRAEKALRDLEEWIPIKEEAS